MDRMIEDMEKYWDEKALKYGDTPRGIGWGSRFSQETRFRTLSKIITRTDSSILDVGCGSGQLCLYLRGKGWNGTYTGLDISQEMLNLAVQKVKDGRFIKADLLKTPLQKDHHYIILSGTLNNRIDDDFGQYVWAEGAIKRMWDACKKAVAFNMLSTWGGKLKAKESFAYDPIRIIKFCRNLTPKLVFDHSYLPHDFTIFIMKDSNHV